MPGRRGRRGQRQLRRHAAGQARRGDHLQRPADADRLGLDREGLRGPRLRRGRSADDRRRGRDRPRHGEEVRLQGRRHGHADVRRAGQAVQGLRHRHDRRQGQPRRRAAGRHDAARGAADDRPRRLRLDLDLDRQQQPGHGQGGGGQKALGRDFNVRTGKEAAEQQAQDLSDALGFIRTALLVFAAVALLVGGFLIFNTFTVTVAQRTKEFALLRVLGASRRAGAALGADRDVRGRRARVDPRRARGHRARARAGRDAEGVRDRSRARPGLVISPGTVIIGLVIGVVATMVSGFVPARRATRVEPVTAMRDAVTPGRRPPAHGAGVVGSIALMGARPAGAVLRALRRRRLDLGRRLAARPRRGADDVRRRVPGAAAGAAAGARARRADGPRACRASSRARTRSASRSARR